MLNYDALNKAVLHFLHLSNSNISIEGHETAVLIVNYIDLNSISHVC